VQFPLSSPQEPAAAAPVEPEESVPPQEAAAAQKVRTVLYVEDQDLNLRLVERILLHHKEYKLISSMEGRPALLLAREARPDIILLDLNLPDMSGEEVLRRLKSDPDLRDIPVIMVSADAIGERIDQLLELGATSYLTKPYKVADLLSRLRSVES
jgi:CheY-like chemotaxis protein